MFQSVLRAVRLLTGANNPATSEVFPEGAGPAENALPNPLTGIRRLVQDAQAVVEQQFEAARLMDRGLGEIEGLVLEAWRDQQATSGEYYELLRSVLAAIDECLSLEARQSEVATVQSLLERTLRAHDVEPMRVAPGDRFRPSEHCCEQAEPTAESPPGTVLQVLERGYQRHLASGAVVVVRPARVVVSKAAGPKAGEGVPDVQ